MKINPGMPMKLRLLIGINFFKGLSVKMIYGIFMMLELI